MFLALLEALIGIFLIVILLSKFIKLKSLSGIYNLWFWIGDRVSFVNKWWFNFIFAGISLTLIIAPIMEFKASRLGIDRDQYTSIQSDANKNKMSVEQYIEEGKRARELKFKDTATYLEAKKFGLVDPVEFAYARELGRTLSEWKLDKENIAKSGQSMQQYVESTKANIVWEKNLISNISKMSAQELDNFQKNANGLNLRMNREQEAEYKKSEEDRDILKKNSVGKSVSNQECEYRGMKQVADQKIYCYASVGNSGVDDGSKVVFQVSIDSSNSNKIGEIYPEDKFVISGTIKKVSFAFENTRWLNPVRVGDAIINIEGRVDRK